LLFVLHPPPGLLFFEVSAEERVEKVPIGALKSVFFGQLF